MRPPIRLSVTLSRESLTRCRQCEDGAQIGSHGKAQCRACKGSGWCADEFEVGFVPAGPAVPTTTVRLDFVGEGADDLRIIAPAQGILTNEAARWKERAEIAEAELKAMRSREDDR